MDADVLTDLIRLEGVPSAVTAARDAVDAVLRDRGVRRVAPDQAAAARLRGARASAELTGDPERWWPGAVRLADALPELSRVLPVAPAQALARAHTLAAAGASTPVDRLGRVRPDPEVGLRVRTLVDLLRRPAGDRGLVLAAVAHAELATVRPFGSADDLVARSVERMVLVSSGVDPAGLVAVEAGHETEGYAAALRGYAEGGVAGVRDWILHCCRALTAGAELTAAQWAGVDRTRRSGGGRDGGRWSSAGR